MNFRIVFIALVFISYLFSSPYIVANRMLDAAHEHDAETLIGYIDFPALRDSVKDQLKKLLQIEMHGELQRRILAAISSPSTKLLTIEEMIDLAVTDKSLRALLVNMKNNKAGLEKLIDEVSMGWRGFGEFTVTVKRRREVKFILSRDKFVFWKLTAAILPIRQEYLQRAI